MDVPDQEARCMTAACALTLLGMGICLSSAFFSAVLRGPY